MINPFYAGDDVEHKRAQHSTLASIEHAAALARAQSISVEVVLVMYPEDVEKLGQDFERWTKDKIMSNGERVAGFKVAMLNVSGVTALPQVPPACHHHHHHHHHLLSSSSTSTSSTSVSRSSSIQRSFRS